MEIQIAASRLFTLMADANLNFTNYLVPGLPKEQVDAILSVLDFTLPTEAREFYENFGFQAHYQYEASEPTFFGSYWILNLQEAVDKYLESRDFFNEFYLEYPNRFGWFPFLTDDSCNYYLDTANAESGACPIIQVVHGGEPIVTFSSLTKMFETFYRWLHEEALCIEDGSLQVPYDGNRKLVGLIARTCNPDVELWNCAPYL